MWFLTLVVAAAAQCSGPRRRAPQSETQQEQRSTQHAAAAAFVTRLPSALQVTAVKEVLLQHFGRPEGAHSRAMVFVETRACVQVG